MKKKMLAVMTAIFLVGLAGCGQKDQAAETNAAETNTEIKASQDESDEATKIALLLPGVLGDKSFFDSAQRGMEQLEEIYGDKIEVKTVEMGQDATRYLPTLYDFSDSGWDVIITGTWLMPEQVTEVAPQYKDITYITFDTSVDYAAGEFENVYSIEYKANESAFLGGILAASMTSDESLEFSNPEKQIGFLGGADNPGINDFLVGYIQGALYVDPEIKVNISNIGSFTDSAKGKEMALAQYNAGCDISFNVAGPAGLGMIDAAMDAKKYVLGVDSDQAMLFAESDPKKSELIASSVMKNVDASLVRAIDLYFKDELPLGSTETLGLKENGVSLAENEYYDQLVSEEIKGKIKEAYDKIVSGELQVDTAYGKTTEEIEAIRKSVE